MATVHAIYEHGVLRPTEPLDLAEGAEVEVTGVQRPAKEPADPRRAAEILAKIAALAIEGDTSPFSGEDHDTILYSDQGAR